MKKSILGLGFVLALGLWGCKQDPPISPNESTLTFEAKHQYNSGDLTLNDTYVTPFQDTFKLTKLAYYISNIELMGDGINNYKIPESYWLVTMDDMQSLKRAYANIPTGKYRGIKFLVGVDAARNTSGAQEGDLDPAKDMFWTWSTGYIMFKLEGDLLSEPQGKVMIHLGGFGVEDNVVHEVTIEKPFEIKAETESLPINVDLYKLFQSEHYSLKLSETNLIHETGPDAVNVSKNLYRMFSL